MKGKDIRQKFLDYFRDKGHTVLRSSSLIPKNDPTLLFTNAGMVQFKNVFTGAEKREYSRAATAQKCVRAGGKHNDLDNVGYTARHHTFFEMLGNFSFGDYFKEDAIKYGWDLLTGVYGLPAEKLWVTVYREDNEAYDIWLKDIGISEDRIKKLGEKDNFWQMGDTGPCGPCSEILIDQGEKFGCGKPDCTAGCDCDRYLELWNLVFMQYNRDDSGKLHDLPNPSIDTGMGLERICAVLQGVESNYETDLIRDIISGIEKLSGKNYREDESTTVSMRVIADHARAIDFLISDGVFPSNEGRGYVLRRILRRAVRHSKFLGIDDPFIYKVLPYVNGVMGETYPELTEREDFVSEVVKNEEVRFLETVDRGLELLGEEVQKLDKGDKTLPGGVVFRLYDTYGFPVDLTQDLTKQSGIKIDFEGFQREMEKQKQKSRKAQKGSGEDDQQELYAELVSSGIVTDFVGYEELESDAVIRSMIKNGATTDTSGEGDEVDIIVDVTPFYGESGGQIGDKGEITAPGFRAKVVDTKKPFPDLFVHKCVIEKGTAWMGDKVKMNVDSDFRGKILGHHTSTHILHAVLKETLGSHVKQAGSLVTPDKLRFDFSHYSSISSEEISNIEDTVNERIRRDDRIVIKSEVPYDKAVESGATAIFEEKYGDKVRVVSIGDYSMELCGGTHVKSTGEIGLLKIVLETASSSGVRRIEAVCGDSAWNYIKNQTSVLKQVSAKLKSSETEIVPRLERLLEENENLKKELESYKSKELQKESGKFAENIEEIKGVNFIAREVSVNNPGEIRTIWDELKQKMSSGVAVFASRDSGKAVLLVGVTKDLTDRYHAGNMVKELAVIVGGKGGGRPDMAQAGGDKPENIPQMLEKAKELL